LCIAIVAIALAPMLIRHHAGPARGLDALLGITLAVKLYDLEHQARQGRWPPPRMFWTYLVNPCWLVLGRTPRESSLTAWQNTGQMLRRSGVFLIGLGLCIAAFGHDWSSEPFLLEHAAKACAIYVALIGGTNAFAAGWRLLGGTALDPFYNPATAPMPADFWRRWNRPAAQFFHEYVFLPAGGRARPVRAILATFACSALVHEYLFTIAIGRLQGFQIAFFMLQGVAVLLTARRRSSGWRAAATTILTFGFVLLTSVLFFASCNHLVPFYSRPLPCWLETWDRLSR
jgi:hypothetical protein